MPAIAAVFEKGVFRPLKPVVLPDQYPSEVIFDDPHVKAEPLVAECAPLAECPELPAPVYPEVYPDLGEDTYEYHPVPPEDVRTIRVRVIDLGHLPPQSYYDEE